MNLSDSVEAAVLRKQSKMTKIRDRARAHAKKMMNFDVAVQTTLAETYSDLEGEMASFGKGKIAFKMYLQEQFKSRKLLRNGTYNTIPLFSLLALLLSYLLLSLISYLYSALPWSAPHLLSEIARHNGDQVFV